MELVVMTTKRVLVAHNEAHPQVGRGDFLAVVFDKGSPQLWGLRSRRIQTLGRVVFLGKEVTEDQLYDKLVASGRKIEDAGSSLDVRRLYLHLLQNYKFGNVMKVAPTSDAHGFELIQDL